MREKKEQTGKMDMTSKAFSEFLKTLTVGQPEIHENLTVFPVFTTNPQRNGYSLLDEAVKTGKFTVTEVTEGGSVQNLKVENGLDNDVLILDGDILIGAKQNRSVTTTIIIGKRTVNVVNVNCVEQGRWSYKSSKFSASDRPMYSRARAVKARSVTENLKTSKSFAADQGEVWDDIAAKSVKFSTCEPSFCRSATGAADEMYSSFDDKIKKYAGSFKPTDGQVGFVVLIGGKVAGCDIFGNPGVLSRVYGKGLRSYFLDASLAIMSGEIDITTLKNLLGHKDIKMTLRYAHLAPAHNRKAANVMDRILSLPTAQPQPTAQLLHKATKKGLAMIANPLNDLVELRGNLTRFASLGG